jgi:hypothetical protein
MVTLEENVTKLKNHCYDEKNFKVPRLLKRYWASSKQMLGKLSIVGAVAATLVFPAALSAQVGGIPNVGPAVRGAVDRGIPGPLPDPGARGVVVDRGGPIIGRRYHGGIWYGTGRRFWRGRWYAYGIGPCWRSSLIGFVWTCG